MKRICLLLLTVTCAGGYAYSQDTQTQSHTHTQSDTANDTVRREIFYEDSSVTESRTSREWSVSGESEVEVEDRFSTSSPIKEEHTARHRYSVSFGNSKTRTSPSIRWNDGHYSGIILSYNGLVSSLGNLSLPAGAEFLTQRANSIGVSINPIDYALAVGKRVAFVTGLGFEFNNFRFENNIGLRRENGVTVADYRFEDMGINVRKSKLSTAYMNVPILVEVQMGHRNDWFINAGVVGGLKIGSHTKVVVRDGRTRDTYKNHGNLGLRNFHYGYMVNVGYRWVALSATYYPVSIFRSGQGPDVEQINIGLGIMF